MRDFYDQWDQNDAVYRTLVARDKADQAARDRKEPGKMVVPVTYSQINTFITFCYSLLTQRERFFELTGYTPDDEQPAKIGEALLARDLEKNIFTAKLWQFLLDIARFNLGVLKIAWVTEHRQIRETLEVGGTKVMGITLTKKRSITTVKDTVSFQGNRLYNVSPYRFFPDTRKPLVEFQTGEFVACEDLWTIPQLKQLEKEGVVVGVDHIPALGKEANNDRRFNHLEGGDPVGSHEVGAGLRGSGQSKPMVVITEVQRWLVPKQYEVEGKSIGDEDYPIMYNIWIANDKRVVKCEPMDYAHGEFTYALAPFAYDNNNLLGNGLADSIDQLQSVITWFINSRITNVRKVISDKLLVKVDAVNMTDLQERRPIIRINASAVGDFDRYIKQLDLQDVTTNHIGDVKFLLELVQLVTGVNDSMLGQFQPGRRPAAEHRNVATGAASRLRTICSIIFDVALKPVGNQMISNLRDGLDEETYVRLLGEKAIETPEFIKVTKENLVGRYSFETLDGVLPSERQYNAQALMEVLGMVMQNPEAAVAFNLDPKKILMTALKWRGIRNPEQFEFDEDKLNDIRAQIAGTAGGRPGDPASGVDGAVQQPLLPALAGGGGVGAGSGQPGGGNGRY
jgi:hypothetical protein